MESHLQKLPSSGDAWLKACAEEDDVANIKEEVKEEEISDEESCISSPTKHVHKNMTTKESSYLASGYKEASCAEKVRSSGADIKTDIKDEVTDEDLKASSSPQVSAVKLDSNVQKKAFSKRDLESFYTDVAKKSEVAPYGSSYSCRFACGKCPFSTSYRASLVKHFHETGHVRNPTEIDVKHCLKTAFAHICRFCGERVLYECSILYAHLANMHQTNVTEYNRQFKIVKHSEARDKFEAVIASAETSEGTASICTFYCPKCEFEANTVWCLRTHFKETFHARSKVTTGLTYINYLKKAVCHICKICSERLLCESSFLVAHMRKEHSIPLTKYNEQFGIHCSKSIESITRQEKLEAESKLKAILEKAEVCEEARGLCTFQCNQCDFQCKSANSLRCHFQKSSHGPKCLSKASIVDFIKTAVCHPCKICSQRLLSEATFLTNHLKQKHNCSVFEYRLKYVSTKQNKVLVTKSDNKEFLKKLKTILSEAKVSAEPRSLCLFKCKKCAYSVRRKELMISHIRNTNHGKLTTSRNAVFEYLGKAVCHICKICGERIFSETRVLQSHMKSRHKMSLRDYKTSILKSKCNIDLSLTEATFSEYVIGNMCKYACSKCKVTCNKFSTFAGHLRECSPRNPSDIQNPLSNFMVKKVWHKCVLCSKVVLCDMRYLDNHFRYTHQEMSVQDYCAKSGCVFLDPLANRSKIPDINVLFSEDIAFRCDFICLTCSKTFGKWTQLKKHIGKEKHDISLGREKVYQDFVSKAVWYSCKLCKEKLLCDKAIITTHALSRHGTTLGSYRNSIGICNRTDNKAKYKEYLNEIMQTVPKSSKQAATTVDIDTIKGQATKHVGYLCEFKCHICSASIVSWFALKFHMRRTHQYLLKMKTDHRDMINRWVFHKCLRCSKAVLCDPAFIYYHLLNHRISYANYQEEVKKNGGRVVPSLQQFLKEHENDKKM